MMHIEGMEPPPTDNDWLKVQSIREVDRVTTGNEQKFDLGGELKSGMTAQSNTSGGDVKVIGPVASYPSEAAPPDNMYELQDTVSAARFLLENATGLDVETPHGQKTPERFVRMLMELTTPEPFDFTTFPAEGYDQLITVRNIPFVSLCNHHIVPFVGVAHVGYIPQEKMAGLSKLARTVKFFAAALQTQERLTSEIADHIQGNLDPLGVAVVIDAEHFCMTIRGVQAPGSLTRTSAMLGAFSSHDRTAKAEFMSGIDGA
jgi:GTP cyclohydrolase I